MDMSHILDWRLLSGSHDFPGPDGGTCINEAAIIASGFEYKSVSGANDCPPCFSRPIAAYAIHLNDLMPDNLRNKLLMPFVTRLNGTADTKSVERKRQEFITINICNRLIPMSLSALKMPDLAQQFADAKTLEDVRMASLALDLALARDLDLDLALALDLARARALDLDLALALALALDLARARALQFWTIATQILDEAIMLGNHGSDIEQELVVARLSEFKKRAKVLALT